MCIVQIYWPFWPFDPSTTSGAFGSLSNFHNMMWIPPPASHHHQPLTIGESAAEDRRHGP